MTCSKCGNELNEGAKFCIKCGSKVKVKLNRLFIPSVILMSIGIILPVSILIILHIPIGIILSRSIWILPFIFVFEIEVLHIFGIGVLLFFSGIMLALISLYMNKHKMTMIVGIVACALMMLLLGGWAFDIINIILSGAIILTFILLYRKKHKIILIAGLAVIALFFVVNLYYYLHSHHSLSGSYSELCSEWFLLIPSCEIPDLFQGW